MHAAVIRSGEEALETAAALAAEFAEAAAEHDVHRRLSHAELERAARGVRVRQHQEPSLFRERRRHPGWDPLLVQRFGEPAITERAARALLAEAGRAIEHARHDLTDENTAAASLAVATAKTYADRAAVELTSALFEASGTRSALEELNLHRHRRNAARTPCTTPPPRHGVI